MGDTDKVPEIFDEWAADGRDQKLEEGHRYSVRTFLDMMVWDRPFSFLDVGCGNGWVIRHMASRKMCTRAAGIDKSRGMIGRALDMAIHGTEEYHVASLERWTSEPFDVAFSMESLYYSPSVPEALSCIRKLLVCDGVFVCGTDYYTENADTAYWDDMMDTPLHLYSESEWLHLFEDAGFKTSHTYVKNPDGDARWKREMGTLFITGRM